MESGWEGDGHVPGAAQRDRLVGHHRFPSLELDIAPEAERFLLSVIGPADRGRRAADVRSHPDEKLGRGRTEDVGDLPIAAVAGASS